MFDDIHKPMLDWIGLMIATQCSKLQKSP